MDKPQNYISAKVELTPQLDDIEVSYGRNFFDEKQKKIGELKITLDNDETIKAEVKLEF